MSEPVRWRTVSPGVRAEIERWVQAGAGPGPGAELLRDNRRRRLLRLRGSGGHLLIKHFRVASGRHPLREHLKAGLGRSPARREWLHLRHLHARGVPVAEPLAWGVLPDGDRLLVLRFVPGRDLDEALREAKEHRERRALLEALGRAVAALHAAGRTHGDLHAGNVRVGSEGPVLLDLQHARAQRGARGRLRDLGALDYSLAGRLSLADRVRLRAACLGLARPFDAAARTALREVGRACAARAGEHGRSRTRRALRPGRRFARLRLDTGRGLRLRDLPEDAVIGALAEHDEAQRAPADSRVLKRDPRTRVSAVSAGERPVIVKQTSARGLARALADAFRGSAARRAWRGGHGLLARGIGAATPLAFVERRRAGLPLASWVVLEDLRPALPADVLAVQPAQEGALAELLARLCVELHRREVDHGDLKASHVYVLERGQGLEARLLDLEGVRFRRKLGERRRIRALCQLNASLPDSFSAAGRCNAFARYARAHPFREGSQAALRRVVEGSLARRHRWSGAGCKLAGPS